MRATSPIRVEFFGDEIDRICQVDLLTGEVQKELKFVSIPPASHYVMPQETINRACDDIEKELNERVAYFKANGKLLEAQRIEERTNFDIEMLRETRACAPASRTTAGTCPA
jgi:excinuclease ABC subunit B